MRPPEVERNERSWASAASGSGRRREAHANERDGNGTQQRTARHGWTAACVPVVRSRASAICGHSVAEVGRLATAARTGDGGSIDHGRDCCATEGGGSRSPRSGEGSWPTAEPPPVMMTSSTPFPATSTTSRSMHSSWLLLAVVDSPWRCAGQSS